TLLSHSRRPQHKDRHPPRFHSISTARVLTVISVELSVFQQIPTCRTNAPIVRDTPARRPPRRPPHLIEVAGLPGALEHGLQALAVRVVALDDAQPQPGRIPHRLAAA